MSPIYKFILDEETGKITVQEITEYRVKENEFTHRKTYIHKTGYGSNYTREESFDQLKHSTVYSFNPDIEHAKQVIWESITAKYDKAYKEVQRWQKVLQRINRKCMK